MEFDWDIAELDEETQQPEIPAAFQATLSVRLDDELHIIPSASVAYEPGKEYLAIVEQAGEHAETMLDRTNQLKVIKEEVEELRAKYNEAIYALSAKQREIDASLAHDRTVQREYERQVYEASKKLRVALESEKIQKEFLENSTRFDALTASAAWREWAFPHQLEGAKLIASATGRAILGDKMGLGKTLTVLIAARMLEQQRILIIVPDDIVGNFYAEVKHWEPSRTVMHIAKMAKRQRNALLDLCGGLDEFTVIVNYSAWRKDFALLNKLDSLHFSMVILENSTRFDALTASAAWREWAFPHQLEGAKLIASATGRAILGDKMGLGKTLTVLIAARMLEQQRILIIVPDDIVGNFYAEVKHWEPSRTVMHIAKMAKRQRNALLDLCGGLDEFTVIVNYSAWRKDFALLNKLDGLHFSMVILDEAHTVKETTTNAYRGVKRIILSDNSCPECRGNIQKVHISADRKIDLINEGHYAFAQRTRDAWVCVGKHTANDTVIPEEYVKGDGCGWNEVRDQVNNVKREYGALRSVQAVVPMTGTPILNKPADLFSLLTLIWPEKFNNLHEFERIYCERNYANKWIFKPGGLKRLTNQLAGRYIARDRHSAGVILPKQTRVVHSVEMDEKMYPGQAKVIRDLTQHAMLMLQEKTMPVIAAIALITRKRQANVWPAGIKFTDADGMVVFDVGDEIRESIKLDRLLLPADRSESGDSEGLIAEFTAGGDFTNGDRVVVFSQFKQPLKELEERIANAGISVVRFDGDTSQDVRDQVRIDFDRKYCDQPGYEPKWQVVLANYRTGGVGLNFTGATQMIMLDEEWNSGKDEQAANRIDRIGQTEETTVHTIRLENSIDDWMAELIESKRQMVEGFDSNASLANDLLAAMREGRMM